LRYVSFGAVLTIVYLTEIVPVAAMLLGLASFALAIIIEAVIRLFSSVFKKEV
jgi:chromate transport protein ChrA